MTSQASITLISDSLTISESETPRRAFVSAEVITVSDVSDGAVVVVASTEESITSTTTNAGVSVGLPNVQIVQVGVGPRGPQGPSGSGITVAFAYNDVAEYPLYMVDAGKYVLGITVHLIESFDGIGADLTIGDSGNYQSVVPSGYIDPMQAASFEVCPVVEFGSDTMIYLKITPGAGATKGNGIVSISLQQ